MLSNKNTSVFTTECLIQELTHLSCPQFAALTQILESISWGDTHQLNVMGTNLQFTVKELQFWRFLAVTVRQIRSTTWIKSPLIDKFIPPIETPSTFLWS